MKNIWNSAVSRLWLVDEIVNESYTFVAKHIVTPVLVQSLVHDCSGSIYWLIWVLFTKKNQTQQNVKGKRQKKV